MWMAARNIGDDLEKSWNRIKPLHAGIKFKYISSHACRYIRKNTDIVAVSKEHVDVYGAISDDGDQSTSTGEDGYAIDENQLTFNMPQFRKLGKGGIYKHYKAHCKQSLLLNNTSLKKSYLGMLEACDGNKHPLEDDVFYLLPDVAPLRATMLEDDEAIRIVVTMEIVAYTTYLVYNPKYEMTDDLPEKSKVRLRTVTDKGPKEKENKKKS